MMINQDMIYRFLEGEATDEEVQLLEVWFMQLGKDKHIDQVTVEQIANRLDLRMFPKAGVKVGRIGLQKIYAAASIILFVFGFLGFKFLKNNEEPILVDIAAPTGSNSIIVYDHNKELDLDAMNCGDSVLADGYYIIKNIAGEVTYKMLSKSEAVVYNSIRTRSGGFTCISLSDGTKVWINANSEIKYPVLFATEKREVSLQGEAYFEVKKAKDRPFYVRSHHHTIKVLGTRFNVDNQVDGYVSTLLEGRISISNEASNLGSTSETGFPIELKPNQSFDGERVRYVENTEKVIDWKEGYFDFTDLTLEEACEKLANWYGIQINIDNKIKDRRIFGQIGREKTLREVLANIKLAIPIQFDILNNQVNIITLKK